MTLFAVAIGIDQIVTEGDSKIVMNQVKSDTFHFSQFGVWTHHSRSPSFSLGVDSP